MLFPMVFLDSAITKYKLPGFCFAIITFFESFSKFMLKFITIKIYTIVVRSYTRTNSTKYSKYDLRCPASIYILLHMHLVNMSSMECVHPPKAEPDPSLCEKYEYHFTIVKHGCGKQRVISKGYCVDDLQKKISIQKRN